MEGNADGSIQTTCRYKESDVGDMMRKLQMISTNRNASFWTNTVGGIISVTCVVVTIATAGLAAPITAPIGIAASGASFAVTKTLKDNNNLLLNRPIGIDNSDLINIGKIGFNLITLGAAEILEATSVVVDAAG